MKVSSLTMTKIVLMILLVSGFTLLAEAAVPVVEITPSRFELLVEPRGKNVQAVKISNMGQEDLSFVASTQDWDMSPEGSLVIKEAGTTDHSASNWIRFNPKKFTIGSGKTQFIRFSVSVPPKVEPGEYRTSLVLVTEDKFEMSKGFFIRPTFAILVYINVPSIERRGEVTDLKVTVSESGIYSLTGQINSTGNAHLRLTGEYFLEDSTGYELQNEQIGKKLILPGRTDSFNIDLGQDLTSGTYKVKLIWYYLPAFYQEGALDEYPAHQEGLVEELTFTI